jgi:Flp pilus assembly pilin Flp
MRSLLLRLFADDGGQDLIEYALLTTAIGLGAVVAFNLLQTAIGTAYGTYTGDAGTVNGLWEPPDPSGGGS